MLVLYSTPSCCDMPQQGFADVKVYVIMDICRADESLCDVLLTWKSIFSSCLFEIVVQYLGSYVFARGRYIYTEYNNCGATVSMANHTLWSRVGEADIPTLLVRRLEDVIESRLPVLIRRAATADCRTALLL